MNYVELDIQEKNISILKKRQTQLCDLKTFYNRANTTKRYKDIVLLDLDLIYKIFHKGEIKFKVENILSLSSSIGKVLELNDSIKSILLSISILEEHKRYIDNITLKKSKNTDIPKNYIYKLFETNYEFPLQKNQNLLKLSYSKNKEEANIANEDYQINKKFYKLIFDNLNTNNTIDEFNLYLNFQKDKKQKINDSTIKVKDIADQVSKMFQGSIVNYYKIYNRCYTVILYI